MGETKIEWTRNDDGSPGRVWNPTRGCSRTSPGCGGGTPTTGKNQGGCYAERQAARFCRPGLPFEGFVRLGKNGPRWTGMMALLREKLSEPLSWRKPTRVFVNSMSDLFHDGLSDDEIAAVFGAMAAAHRHTFQILTKRARRMRDWSTWLTSAAEDCGYTRLSYCLRATAEATGSIPFVDEHIRQQLIREEWPLPNVWLGVSVEDQARADERIPLLAKTPAAVRFLSVEPLLEEVDLRPHLTVGGPDWVIVGGESGPGARPCALEWIEKVVRQCARAKVACFVKQLGAFVVSELRAFDDPEDQKAFGLTSKWAWRSGLIDRKGGDPAEWPDGLHVRQMPGETRS